MVLRYVAMVLVGAAVSVAFEASQCTTRSFNSPKPRDPDLPCPDEMKIKPCTCHTDNVYFMTLDCSLVNTNEDLERIFAEEFPFKVFRQFIIDHDPNDPNNRLTEIHSDIFKELTFERVIIRGTQLESIDENVFSYSHETLNLLNLQNNKINDFPFESLALYKRLETLILDNNNLGTLEKFGSSSLRTLSVGFNRNLLFTYDVLEELPCLVNLNMESIGLTYIPQHMFANLTQVYTINFNGNGLRELQEFTLDPLSRSVGRLLLSNNRIFTSYKNSLQGLQSNAIIDLTNNEITEMPKELWQPFFEQVIDGMVDLTGNDLKCGCDMSWMFLNTTTINSSERYLHIITDHSKCFDGTQVVFLDANVFKKHCT